MTRGFRQGRPQHLVSGRGSLFLLIVSLGVLLLPGCGAGPPTPPAPESATSFELQVKFANVDTQMQVSTALAALNPGDGTHITLDFWDVTLEPTEAYRPVGHISGEGLESLGIAIELYSGTGLAPGSYGFGGEYADCCVPSIVSGGVEYQLLPDPRRPGQVQLESVDLTEGGLVRGYIDLECYYGEIIRGAFTACVHLR